MEWGGGKSSSFLRRETPQAASVRVEANHHITGTASTWSQCVGSHQLCTAVSVASTCTSVLLPFIQLFHTCRRCTLRCCIARSSAHPIDKTSYTGSVPPTLIATHIQGWPHPMTGGREVDKERTFIILWSHCPFSGKFPQFGGLKATVGFFLLFFASSCSVTKQLPGNT